MFPALVPVSGAAAQRGAPTARRPLPFIEDDYAKALAEARAKHLPLFVDAWATWCHTCMSMRAYVFTDPLVMAKADAF
ncbi:MAG: thioredoxin family protein, partial [Polyangiaceae bacterium]